MMPNFLIIGAPRAGTTLLYEGLWRHPEIYMSPVKEPWFFCEEELQIVQDLETYRALFSEVRDEEAIGEASTIYLYSPKAPLCIKQHLPDARLVATLRNPVERAYSQFLRKFSDGP